MLALTPRASPEITATVTPSLLGFGMSLLDSSCDWNVQHHDYFNKTTFIRTRRRLASEQVIQKNLWKHFLGKESN